MPLALRLRPVLAALSPAACWSCRGPAPAAEPLCRGCRARLRFLGPRIVPLAGVRLWAAVAYEGPARPLIHGLKYRGAAGLAEPLAAQMAANVPRELLAVLRAAAFAGSPGDAPPSAPEDAVPGPPGSVLPLALVPVPAAEARRRRRGYDQAALLAVALSRRLALPVEPCLARREGASQVGRSRGARRQALANAIRIRSPPPAAALLVDDVATTGATLSACADALRTAGCARVAAIAYARTPGR